MLSFRSPFVHPEWREGVGRREPAMDTFPPQTSWAFTKRHTDVVSI